MSAGAAPNAGHDYDVPSSFPTMEQHSSYPYSAGPGFANTCSQPTPQRKERPAIAPLQHIPVHDIQVKAEHSPHHSPMGYTMSGQYRNSEVKPDVQAEDPLSANLSQTFYDPHQLKHRRRTTPLQLSVLNGHFLAHHKPDMNVRKQLAEQLDMTPREVQVWFQNRRAKQKKLDARASSEASGDASEPTQQTEGQFPSTTSPTSQYQQVGYPATTWAGTQNPVQASSQAYSTPFDTYNLQGTNQLSYPADGLNSHGSSNDIPVADNQIFYRGNQGNTHLLASSNTYYGPGTSGTSALQRLHNASSSEESVRSSNGSRSLSDVSVPPITYAYSEDESGPYTPITPLTQVAPFPGLSSAEYPYSPNSISTSCSPHDTPLLQSVQTSPKSPEADHARRQSYPAAFLDSFQNLQPYVASPTTVDSSNSLQQQQMQSLDLALLWQRASQAQASQESMRRHSVAVGTPASANTTQVQFPMMSQLGPQPNNTEQTSAAPFAEDIKWTTNASYYQATLHQNLHFEQVNSNTTYAPNNRRISTTILNTITERPAVQKQLYDPAFSFAENLDQTEQKPYANQMYHGQGPYGSINATQAAPQSTGVAGSRRSSVVRKVRSQANLYSPYPVAAGRDAATASLLSYEGLSKGSYIPQ